MKSKRVEKTARGVNELVIGGAIDEIIFIQGANLDIAGSGISEAEHVHRGIDGLGIEAESGIVTPEFGSAHRPGVIDSVKKPVVRAA